MSVSHSFQPVPPELSLEECTTIITKQFKNFNIVNYKILPIETKNGFLGDHRRLLITITNESGEEKQMHYFAKFMPENQSQIDFVVICGVFKKEMFIYEKLFPRIIDSGIDYLLQCVPKCYFAKDNHVLVFEDITRREFKPLYKFEYLDYDHVLVILKSLVKLHASSLIFEEKLSEKQKHYRLLDEYSDDFYETFYVDIPEHKGGQGLKAAIKGLYTGFNLFPEYNSNFSEKFKLKVTETCFKAFELVKPSKRYRNVICHGDLWSTNVMVKYNNNQPSESILIDFQTARYLPPGHDFMSFIYLTTSRKFRSEHFQNLQAIYYEELNKLLKEHDYDLKTLIPFEEFIASCKEQKAFAIVQAATYCQLTQAKDKWIMNFAKNNELWDEALYRDRSQMVIDNCQTDLEYRFMFKEVLKDLYEYCDNI